ncbi:efflux RND transporter periplasmic adaptor subunit [Rhizobium sp. L1K21]|uniref:efflux RND transporter periplasmic adaptor subunit n=1 Tax=Rhizobium sp. L1K21 TaxID=2954933 RepID=UPI0020926137|nr:HlyD family efflux transporter periplasmic adaptor subunit [Rhizobium sp. L1K21]MCO6186460.1 HlyD family efflux transporter periplasmic adaptor subunit [Rhizobium sp. L1K21]
MAGTLSTWIKRGAMAAGVIAIAAGFAYALREKPVMVDLAEITSTPMKVTVREEAETRVRDVYAVSAPIAGNLDRVAIEEGTAVTAGKTIVAAIRPLDPPLIDKRSRAELTAARDAAKAAVAIARVNLRRAQTGLDQARADLERAQALAKTSIIASSTLQKANTALQEAEAQTHAALATIALRQAELETAEARLIQPDGPKTNDPSGCCVDITAPVDGVVLNVLVKSEQPVQAGTKIAEIGDPAKLEVVAGLLSSDAVKVKAGSPAEIVNWGGPPLKATVRRVDPAAYTKVSALGIEEQRVKVILDLDENDPRLGHEFRVYADIAIWKEDDVLQVPIAALFRVGNDWTAFVVRDGRAAETKVTIDHMNNLSAEVTDGLQVGDRVILYPSDKLSDGSLVEERPQ